jgi:hypothetical protein
MQREYTGVYPDSGKEGPTSSKGGEYCISLHRSACVGLQVVREGAGPKSQERERWSVA